MTLTNPSNPADKHDAFMTLGGAQFQVAVLRKPHLKCKAGGGARVQGRLDGVGPGEKRISVYVVGVDAKNRFVPRQAVLARLLPRGGVFSVTFRGRPPTRAVCLFAGTTRESSASSLIFTT